MTPIEIFQAWQAGKKLDYLGDPVTGLQFRVWTGEGLTAYRHDYNGKVKKIPEVTISREIFGFDEARKRMREGKVIGKEGTGYKFRLVSGDLQKGCDGKWFTLKGYPLDWPDAQDFYEGE